MSSASSNTVTATTVNGRQLFSGLSSGLDVDSMVESTMASQKWKLYKLQQQQQLTQWRQEAYRSVIDKIKTFADTYLNLTSSSNMLSAKNLQKFHVTSTDSSFVSAAAHVGASTGSHTLAVSQLATAATLSSSSSLSKDVQGTKAADFSAAAGKSFIISIDGAERTITLDVTVTDVDGLQSTIDKAVGAGKITVSTDGDTGALVFSAAVDSGIQMITLSNPSGGSSSALSVLGFGDGAILSNRLSTASTLETLSGQMNRALTFNSDGQVSITINGMSFAFDKSATLDEVITEINQSSAGAKLNYDEFSGRLTLTADETGAGNTLAVSETDSNFIAAMLDQATAGQDAKFTLDGQSLTRSSNSITVSGVTYSLKAVTSGNVTIAIEQNTDGIYDTISNFVNAYNTLIESINSTIAEEYDYDYPPLTDAQKEEMTEEEIAKWEKKAKTGILANDSLMKNMLTEMRSALMNAVPGAKVSLAAIGITTSAYSDKGKLAIDEDKLKEAISSNLEGIASLFTKQSAPYPGTTTARTLTSSQLAVRSKEEGLAYRLYDIIQKNISTIRDSSGNKGLMILKAGIEDDISETENRYSESLDEYQEKITKEEERLDELEETLYNRYSALETALNQLSSQFAALSSFTSA